MHEYSIVQSMVTKVEAEAARAGALKVHGVQVALGELSGVDPQLRGTASDTFRAGTGCEAAALTLTRVAARWGCKKGCGAQVAPGGVLTCPACGAPAKLLAGDEILLERVELEVP